MPGTPTRWDPHGELADLRSRFDRMFGDWGALGGREFLPAIDVERDDGSLIVRADVPGFRPDEISIEVEDEMLTIAGKHEEAKETKGKHYLRQERRYGSFSRSIALPAGVDADKISAQTHDGVLEVKVPLPEEKGEHKKVTISAKAD